MKKTFAVPEKHTRIVELFIYQSKDKNWLIGGKDEKGLDYILPNFPSHKEYGITKINFTNFKQFLKYNPLFYIPENGKFLSGMGYERTAPRAGFHFISGFKTKGDYK